MNRQFLKDAFGWGAGLWLIGFMLGFIFFAFVPPSMLGWVIMPFGILATLWILLKKVQADSFGYYMRMALVWVLIAVVFDYIFIVKMLNPADGYYKLDIYLYYALTFALPVAVGWRKK